MAVLVTENFTSAPAFTQVGGALVVSGGRLRPTTNNTDCAGYSNTDMGTTDHYVQADLVTTADTSDNYCSVLARWDGIDPNLGGDGYVFQQNFDSAVLYGANSGTFNTLATITGAFATPGTYTLRLEVNGNSISAKINGAHISGSPFTNSLVTVGGKVGLSMYLGTATSDSEFDNFEGGDFNAAGLIVPLSIPVISRSNLRR